MATKVNIKEANEHLQALHKRVYELDSQLQTHVMHIGELEKTNTELHLALTEKEEEVTVLKKQLDTTQEELNQIQGNEKMIRVWKQKAAILDSIMEHKQSLAAILNLLGENELQSISQ
jgi:chromosome segregation ATPase